MNVDEKIREIKEKLDKHRSDAVITCGEDCWCWDVEMLISILETFRFPKSFDENQIETIASSLLLTTFTFRVILTKCSMMFSNIFMNN
jgi:hypothetical protein